MEGGPIDLSRLRQSMAYVEEWLDGGFSDVFAYNESHRQIHAAPWHPDWLNPIGGRTIDVPLVARRNTAAYALRRSRSFLELKLGLDRTDPLASGSGTKCAHLPAWSTLTVLLPTGGGKSLLAHLPALLDERAVAGLVLTIVPTVALALDRARAFEADYSASDGLCWTELTGRTGHQPDNSRTDSRWHTTDPVHFARKRTPIAGVFTLLRRPKGFGKASSH